MSIQDRIHTLRRHGLGRDVTAAILNITPALVHEHDLDPSTAEPPSDPVESGSDLSAVDEDIVVVNEHGVRLQGDWPANAWERVDVAFDANSSSLMVTQDPDNGATDVTICDPDNPLNSIKLRGSEGSSIFFGSDGLQSIQMFRNPADPASLQLAAAFEPSDGLILQAPDDSRHRLVVANDGTLSTEPVV